jgi:4-methylaminobutanoate oxidase (formaldehyde-forming)
MDESLKPNGWVGKNWHPAVSLEHFATRNSAGLFDESSFSKIMVKGNRSGEFLNYVCANNVVKGVGRTTYTQALNKKGGIESDYTVTQVAIDEFLIITGTAFLNHDKGWLEKVARESHFEEVEITDITKQLACFGIWGPNARKILHKVTNEDLSNQAFGFMHSKLIELGGVNLRATRITYVGELGWELYVPADDALKVWLMILEAGKEFNLRPCGYRAIESLRLEKGYRAWAGEINSETNPFEAGLGFAVAMKKDNFVGKAAIERLKDNQSRKLSALTFDDIKDVAMGNEPIFINNSVVGRVKSAGQGYSIKKAIAYAYLPADIAKVGTKVEVEMFGSKKTATIEAEPLFDPQSERVKS